MKYSFGGHGSFQMRYGWLTKGFRAFNKNADVFTSDDATALLGVGKNMVSSIKYWLNATKIINNKGNTEFGKKLLSKNGFDPYLEDDAALWLLHLKLVQNAAVSTSIYWLFNHFHKSSFILDEAFNALDDYMSNKAHISKKTLKMDISVILRMYAPHKSEKTQIEDMLESPLSLLNLIEYHDGKYHFMPSEKAEIPVEIIAYTINENFREATIPIKDLMYGDNIALGKVLKMSEDDLIAHLERLVNKYPSEYQLREDAGIFQLHILKKINELVYLERYYG